MVSQSLWQGCLSGMLVFAATAVCAAQGLTLYVSGDPGKGNDRWSGRLAEAKADGTDGPFATLERARDEVRKQKPKGATVLVRGGTYFLSQPFVLGPEDSGTEEHPIIYGAHPGETVILCGGRRIEGLKPDGNGVYSVLLPEVKEGKWYFRQLFVDGKRRTRARFPNVDPSDPCRKGFLYVDGVVSGFGMTVICIHNPGDWMEYKVKVPADGDYRYWLYYGALNRPHGNTDMAGRTVVTVDGGEPVPLMNLPDTGSWREFKWVIGGNATVFV